MCNQNLFPIFCYIYAVTILSSAKIYYFNKPLNLEFKKIVMLLIFFIVRREWLSNSSQKYKQNLS